MDKFTAAHARAARARRDDRQGRARRRPPIEAIRKYGAAYLMAVGGAAYLVSKAIRASRVVAFADLGMEAIYEFEVKDMPVTVAVDARGKSVHHTAPEGVAGADRQDPGAPRSSRPARTVLDSRFILELRLPR